MSSLAEARAELRKRLGRGARYDDPAAPATELAWVRTGTAHFARRLNELSDSDLGLATRSVGLTRRHVIASISYEARAMAEIAEWARHGRDTIDRQPFTDASSAVGLAVTLPAEALRHLFRHSSVHLNVEWRDLAAGDWDFPVRLPDGHVVTSRRMAARRAESIWLGAADLGNGTLADLPAGLTEAIFGEDAILRSATGLVRDTVPQDPDTRLADQG